MCLSALVIFAASTGESYRKTSSAGVFLETGLRQVDKSHNPLLYLYIERMVCKSRYRPNRSTKISVDFLCGAVFFLMTLFTAGCRVIIVPPVLMLTDVRVCPAAADAAPGETFTFTAEVDGVTDQTVTWTIEETGVSAGTFINANGVLVVAPNESLGSLTVRATSGVDNSKSGTAVVTVTTVPTVLSVSVDPPAPVSLAQGESQTFQAAGSGYYDPLPFVLWSIDEADKHENTTIDENGNLFISLDETLTSITVRAAFEADPTKSGAVVVEVRAP
jgi:hypothetical protein